MIERSNLSNSRDHFGGENANVELRYDSNGDLDEVLLNINGKVVMHSERMGHDQIWMGLYPDAETEVHVTSVSEDEIHQSGYCERSAQGKCQT